jgi:hypothetical protein
MKAFLIIILFVLILNQENILSKQDLKKLNHEQLRNMLYQRDQSCEKCLGVNDGFEKLDLIDKILIGIIFYNIVSI